MRKGQITQIIGAVVDVKFEGDLPEILSALKLAGKDLSVAGFHSSRSTPFKIPRNFPEI